MKIKKWTENDEVAIHGLSDKQLQKYGQDVVINK